MKKNELVHVGTFGQPQGLRGEIKINIFTSSLESFKMLKNFFIENEKKPINFKNVRKVGKKFIASLEDCIDRDMALSFRGKNIFVLRESLPKINKDKFYIFDLIKCKVMDKDNIYIGDVIDIKNFGAGDLIEIKNQKGKDFYIPMNNDNLEDIDIENKIIIANPIEGLID